MVSLRFAAVGELPRANWEEFQRKVTQYARTNLRDYQAPSVKTLRGDATGDILQATVIIDVAGDDISEDDLELAGDQVAGQAFVKVGGRPMSEAVTLTGEDDHAASSHTS